MIDDILDDLEPLSWEEQVEYTDVHNVEGLTRSPHTCLMLFKCVRPDDERNCVFYCWGPKGHKGYHYFKAGDNYVYYGPAADNFL